MCLIDFFLMIKGCVKNCYQPRMRGTLLNTAGGS